MDRKEYRFRCRLDIQICRNHPWTLPSRWVVHSIGDRGICSQHASSRLKMIEAHLANQKRVGRAKEIAVVAQHPLLESLSKTHPAASLVVITSSVLSAEHAATLSRPPSSTFSRTPLTASNTTINSMDLSALRVTVELKASIWKLKHVISTTLGASHARPAALCYATTTTRLAVKSFVTVTHNALQLHLRAI